MIRYVKPEDEIQILSMMELVKGDFVGYEETDFLNAVHMAAEKKEALLEEQDGMAVAMLLFSREMKEISFLAVHPDFRKRGIAKRLIMDLLSNFEKGDILQVVTFRAGDEKGTAARACYRACGFVDDEELTVFEYPCQKMILEI
ncbi:GNAT family N-acetyltransferase [Qiania dongpingensis]|uniref:GNAT family N-acetyltransferase n=1 Tax=Qiania dongpingensis TaxID=2763669 RepID=A0A7G9G694_9FIRM|nr:GNAT family N-acetyltransferase [Qiania dongpingensis]QNM06326.1 GNAT family N-acetyltransferase [Qiania dongpingensis]